MTEPTGSPRQPDDGLDEKLDALEEKVLGERADQVRDEESDLDQDTDGGTGSEPS